ISVNETLTPQQFAQLGPLLRGHRLYRGPDAGPLRGRLRFEFGGGNALPRLGVGHVHVRAVHPPARPPRPLARGRRPGDRRHVLRRLGRLGVRPPGAAFAEELPDGKVFDADEAEDVTGEVAVVGVDGDAAVEPEGDAAAVLPLRLERYAWA